MYPFLGFRHLAEKLLEGLGVEREKRHGGVGHDRCRTGAAIDEGHLPHHRTRAERDQMFVADEHAGFTGLDHVTLLPHPTLIDEQFTGIDLDIVGQFGHTIELRVAEALEEGQTLQTGGPIDCLFPLSEHEPTSRHGRMPPSATMVGASLISRPEDFMVSELFDPTKWRTVPGFEDLSDITYHRSVDQGTVRVAFNRPEVRNAFRPQTVDELYRALDHARMSSDVGCVLLTGNGPSPRDGGWAFCSGGDQRIRGKDGYKYAEGETADTIDPARSGRLHILEVQRLIRFMPKVVICVVPGWAAGGGHSLHVVCDLTLASAEHARFKQTDADVASFDGGFGSAYLARQVGQKFAREIFFLGREYSAEQMFQMGAVNEVVAHDDLENVALEWASLINGKSPTAQRMLKYAFNLIDDGLVGQQLFAGEATRLAYGTDEAAEGRDSFLEKRDPNWSAFPWHF